jgi:hypothetical protein
VLLRLAFAVVSNERHSAWCNSNISGWEYLGAFY